MRFEDFRRDLSDLLVVLVGRQQDRGTLHGACGDPDVVRRDRNACSTQGVENDCVALRRFLVHCNDVDAGRGQKLRQLGEVLPESCAFEKASPQLSQHHRIELDLRSFLNSMPDLWMGTFEGRVSGGVEEDPALVASTLPPKKHDGLVRSNTPGPLGPWKVF